MYIIILFDKKKFPQQNKHYKMSTYGNHFKFPLFISQSENEQNIYKKKPAEI